MLLFKCKDPYTINSVVGMNAYYTIFLVLISIYEIETTRHEIKYLP